MIVSNDPPTAPKSSTQNPTSAQPRGTEPPPYRAYQAYAEVQPPPQTYVGYAVGEPPRQSAGQRFIRAFLVATFIWLLFSLLVQSSVTAAHWGHRHRGGLMTISEDWDFNVPAGVNLERCVQGGGWTPSSLNPVWFSAMVEGSAPNTERLPFKSETSFNLPLSSETLFFLSRGELLGGIANVVTSSEQAQDSATVHVVIHYRLEELLDSTKACLISREEGENGVGIFTPVWRDGRRPRRKDHEVVFEMKIILPELSSASGLLTIKNFETDISNSVHRIGDLNGKVFFDSISLKGSNGPIGVQSLTATNGKIHSSNGPISGTFNTTKVLILETSNSPIAVDIGLESDNEGSSPTFNARTSNGKLEADVSLTSASESGGSFDIVTTTSNSPLRINFPASPIDSKLNLKASTSNSPAAVHLNPAYEGSFTAQTSLFGASIRRKADVEDPTGNKRERHVQYRNVGKRVTAGVVYWGTDESKAKGVVDVRTSNSPLVLEI